LTPISYTNKETVFTIGNGYLGTRGSFEERFASNFAQSVYNNVPVVYTELANCPDWLPAVILMAIASGLTLARSCYERQLDLRRGILSRKVRWRSPSGKTLDLNFEFSLAHEQASAFS